MSAEQPNEILTPEEPRRQKIREYRRKYYLKNKDKKLAYAHEYFQKNREKIYAKRKERYHFDSEFREKCINISKRWNKKNKENIENYWKNAERLLENLKLRSAENAQFVKSTTLTFSTLIIQMERKKNAPLFIARSLQTG